MPTVAVSVHPVLEGDLRVAKVPLAILAAAAVRAREEAGLADADPGPEYLVIAVPAGRAMAVLPAVKRAAEDAVNAL